MSEEGIEKRKQRWKVEAVFGNIKQNKGFRRFFLRGLEKVNTELGLIAIAHTLPKAQPGTRDLIDLVKRPQIKKGRPETAFPDGLIFAF